MKYADINRQFTEIVSGYLKAGYTFNTATMGGSQCEIARVDLNDGKNVIRILLQSFYCKDDFYNDGYEIIVGSTRSTISANQPPENTVRTIWNNRLDVVYRREFYEISKRNGCAVWFGNRDEAISASNVRVARRAQKGYYVVSKDDMTGDNAIRAAERYVRRIAGIKHPNRAKLNVRHAIRREDGRVYGQYIITYNGKSYILH